MFPNGHVEQKLLPSRILASAFAQSADGTGGPVREISPYKRYVSALWDPISLGAVGDLNLFQA
jgi:hypothetical protein